LLGSRVPLVVTLGGHAAPSLRVARARARWERALRRAGADPPGRYGLEGPAIVDLAGRAPTRALFATLHTPLTRRAVVRGRVVRVLAALGGHRLACSTIVLVARRAA
jgi:hypothetical protein